jgi:hypothetical protein
MGTQVVELGPVNATIHQVNERILASDLDVLTEIYYQTLVGCSPDARLPTLQAPLAATTAWPARPATASTVPARVT